MPSKSSRSSSIADGEYEWDEPEHRSSHSGKKSRSKLPVEEKLNKRRDQNRVSQRAFRQRKEKHTKELELKVEELESLLENASAENNIVTSQMTKMEEELCYYRRLLFAGNPQTTPYTPTSPAIESWPTATHHQMYSTPPSNGSSSAHSSPTLSNIPGDFGPAVASAGGVESFWGYEVNAGQGEQYPEFKYADTSAYLGQGQW